MDSSHPPAWAPPVERQMPPRRTGRRLPPERLARPAALKYLLLLLHKNSNWPSTADEVEKEELHYCCSAGTTSPEVGAERGLRLQSVVAAVAAAAAGCCGHLCSDAKAEEERPRFDAVVAVEPVVVDPGSYPTS
jgi:hypothetical protein